MIKYLEFFLYTLLRKKLWSIDLKSIFIVENKCFESKFANKNSGTFGQSTSWLSNRGKNRSRRTHNSKPIFRLLFIENFKNALGSKETRKRTRYDQEMIKVSKNTFRMHFLRTGNQNTWKRIRNRIFSRFCASNGHFGHFRPKSSFFQNPILNLSMPQMPSARFPTMM